MQFNDGRNGRIAGCSNERSIGVIICWGVVDRSKYPQDKWPAIVLVLKDPSSNFVGNRELPGKINRANIVGKRPRPEQFQGMRETLAGKRRELAVLIVGEATVVQSGARQPERVDIKNKGVLDRVFSDAFTEAVNDAAKT